MKLGLKEIGAVAALAIAGCDQKPEAVQTAPEAVASKTESVVDQRVLDEFNHEIFLMTHRFKLAVRDACNLEGNSVYSRYGGDFAPGIMSIAASAACEAEHSCLEQAGLKRPCTVVYFKNN